MAPWRGPAPDLLPPGAAAGLKSARPAPCAAPRTVAPPSSRRGFHSRSPALRSVRASAAVSRPACVLLPLLRPLRCS
ncbi:hypothetical protein NDU88_008022 [Pleurodeles waltl]|uniref:Uncharacterized protein n=1 Tax=Pleurodeles waltl TaxID=8319 RepID=A0AAV7NY49_PLEWA|nr:hypothetical protein NDU88_008022 [Pleurodeles waltl]